jgi:hypothetical protein
MATVSVLNTTANISGKTLAICEQVATITALWSFSRSTAAPFAVNSGAAVVTNLDADKVDGVHGTALAHIDQGNVFATGQNQFPAGTVSAPSVSIGDTDVGLYSSATNTLDVTTAGAQAASWNPQGQQSLPLQFKAKAYNSAAQTVNAGANAVLTLDSESFDTGGLHSTSSNTERLTIPTGGTGYYLVIGSTTCVTPGAAGTAEVSIRLNSAGHKTAMALLQTSDTVPIQIVTIIQLTAGDFIDMHAASTTSNISYGSATAAKGTYLEAIRIA